MLAGRLTLQHAEAVGRLALKHLCKVVDHLKSQLLMGHSIDGLLESVAQDDLRYSQLRRVRNCLERQAQALRCVGDDATLRSQHGG